MQVIMLSNVVTNYPIWLCGWKMNKPFLTTLYISIVFGRFHIGFGVHRGFPTHQNLVEQARPQSFVLHHIEENRTAERGFLDADENANEDTDPGPMAYAPPVKALAGPSWEDLKTNDNKDKNKAVLSQLIQWGKDIFESPKSALKVPLATVKRSEWLLFAATVLVLIIFDALVLQRFTGCESTEDPIDTVFKTCDSSGTGFVTKEDIRFACATDSDVAQFFGLHACSSTEQPEAMAQLDGKLQALSFSDEGCSTLADFRQFYIKGETPSLSTSESQGAIWNNIAIVCFWLAVAIIYNVVLSARLGKIAGYQWCSGYLLEWILSMDNLFVFHLIFKVYRTPRELLHKALFMGLVGAVVFRMFFFLAVNSLLHLFTWIRFFFGLLLIYSGIKTVFDTDDDIDVKNSCVVRVLKWCLGSRLIERYDTAGQRLFVTEGGLQRATLLVPVIICLEFVDILFALDSVSAKLAQIPNYFIAYTSSIIALFGLRSFFFHHFRFGRLL